jgi:two-component system sensor histidine kinase UhpB
MPNEEYPSPSQLIDLLPVAVYVCDRNGVITQYNRRAAQVWGREPRCGDPAERFCGATRLYLPDGTLLPHDHAPIAQALRTGLPSESRELILERADGSRKTVLVTPVPLTNQLGEVYGVVNCMLDVTDYKQLEEALRDQNIRLDYVLRNVPVALYEAECVEPFGGIWVSDNVELLTGFPPGRFTEVSEFWASRLHPDDRDRVLKAFATLGDRGSFSCEYRWQCADGQYRWFLDQAVFQRKAEGVTPVLLGSWKDITERREAQDQREQLLNQLRLLSGRIQQLREEDQARLAREIHDELGIQMTNLKLNLARMTDLLIDTDLRTAATALRNAMASMDNTLDQTITTVQRIAADLRPRLLDDLGLAAALEWQVNSFMSRTGIHCQVIAEPDQLQIGCDQTTALFRICQEALTNVARHAQATCVTVRLSETRGQVLLEIEDDGQGIPSEKVTDRMSLGLLGMRERAELLGGEMHISGSPGKGTVIMVRLPTGQAQRGVAPQTL